MKLVGFKKNICLHMLLGLIQYVVILFMHFKCGLSARILGPLLLSWHTLGLKKAFLIAFLHAFLKYFLNFQVLHGSHFATFLLWRFSVLGTGTFGRVFLVRDKKTRGFFALKAMKIPDVIRLKQEQHVHNEKEVLTEVSHPFLVRLWVKTT